LSSLIVAGMLLVSSAPLHADDMRKPLDKPNILMIFADDWG